VLCSSGIDNPKLGGGAMFYDRRLLSYACDCTVVVGASYLTLYGHIKTAEQQHYRDWYTGR